MMLLEPEAERSWVLVGATAKMSLALGCAESTVWRVRYCFDYEVSEWCWGNTEGAYHGDLSAAPTTCVLGATIVKCAEFGAES